MGFLINGLNDSERKVGEITHFSMLENENFKGARKLECAKIKEAPKNLDSECTKIRGPKIKGVRKL